MDDKLEMWKAVAKVIKMKVDELDDKTAAKVAIIVERWKLGKKYKENDRVSVIEGNTVLLYKCGKGKDHISDETNKPSIHTASIWTLIDVEHDGTFEDPIPYRINMELFKDKYYVQNSEVYLCHLGTGIPVFHDLKDLVPLYVTKV